MKSIKPGRGPSGVSFIGSVFAVVFGIFWTIIAAGITAHSPFPFVGTVFPLFGIIFILFGIVNAVYHYKNATGKDRFSVFDINDSSEEGDPAEKWVKRDDGSSGYNYCTHCGKKLEDNFAYCPQCGKKL